MVGKYLPKGVMHQYESPTVSFVIFGYDARGYSPITVDLIFAKDLTRYIIFTGIRLPRQVFHLQKLLNPLYSGC